jgi:REP element-mobilizing transposase RayT
MPRQARLDYPGTMHHVMIRGIEKKKIIKDEMDSRDLVERMGNLSKETGTQIYAWALLSNHAHILLRSGAKGLSNYMRRLLTGYAAAFNRRHRRHGTLFQNRYKSIVCEEEPYFLELVRYIHLNPLRAGVVKSMERLDKYPYGGHACMMGNVKHTWQKSEEVMAYFGKRIPMARKAYRQFVQEGIKLGRQPMLVGGGLIRSQGGWANVISRRRQGDKELSDERILGSGEFIDRILMQAEQQLKDQFSARERTKKVAQAIKSICKKWGVKPDELKAGGRRGYLTKARSEIIQVLVQKHGVPMASVAREIGVTTAAVSMCLRRIEND